jgi:hypothetical protein
MNEKTLREMFHVEQCQKNKMNIEKTPEAKKCGEKRGAAVKE